MERLWRLYVEASRIIGEMRSKNFRTIVKEGIDEEIVIFEKLRDLER
jgi:hypothetical protein